MGLRDRLHFSFWFVRHNKPHSLFIKASLWFTNQISAFKLISCTLSLLPRSVSKTLDYIFFMPYIDVRCPPLFPFFWTYWNKFVEMENLWVLRVCFVKTLRQALYRWRHLQLYKAHGCHKIPNLALVYWLC